MNSCLGKSYGESGKGSVQEFRQESQQEFFYVKTSLVGLLNEKCPQKELLKHFKVAGGQCSVVIPRP